MLPVGDRVVGALQRVFHGRSGFEGLWGDEPSGPPAKLSELGADSLDMFDVRQELEDEFDDRLLIGQDFPADLTVPDIVAYVRERLGDVSQAW